MYWRYLFIAVILVVPRTAVFTTAATQGAAISELSDEELLDQVVSELQVQAQKNSQGQADVKVADKPAAAQAVRQEAPAPDTHHAIKAVGINDVEAPEVRSNVGAAAAETSSQASTSESVVEFNGKAMAHSGGSDGPSIGAQPGSKDTSTIFIMTVVLAASAGFVGILMAGVCYYKFRKNSKAATEVEYPAYGVTGPNKERIPSPGDRKLAQSAQMYHYQHQKQQMIAMEKANGDMKHDASDDDSEEDNVEGDYTVYECPGLAPTGEMEVKNPLFRGDETPVQPTSEAPHTNGGLPNGEEH